MARRPAPIGEARCRRSVMAASLARPATAIVTAVARNPSHGIVRKHGYGRTSHANLLWEKSMPFAKSSPYLRSRSQIEPARRTSQRGVQDPNSNGERALVIPLSHEYRPPVARASATAKAVAALSHFAEHTFPDLLMAIVSWIIRETLAGCTAYAEALYPIPPELEPAPDETSPRRTANHLNLVSVHAREDLAERDLPIRADGETLVQPAQQSAPSFWRAAFGPLVATCASRIRRARARRRAIAELCALDDRSLHDIGLSASDIEYIARNGARHE